MSQKYYDILGVKSDASLQEIKRAFRIRAKHIHPDVNKSVDAHEQFVLLNEAYEFLTRPKVFKTQEDWVRQEKERVRKRAAHYARMKHQEYMNSPAYKAMSSFNDILDYVYVLFGMVFLLLIPVLGYSFGGWVGLCFALPIFILAVVIAFRYIANAQIASFRELQKSIYFLVFRPAFLWFLGAAFSVVVLFKIGLNSIHIRWICLGMFVLMWLGSKIKDRSIGHFNKIKDIKRLILITLLINVLILINSIFARGEFTEVYAYRSISADSPNNLPESTLLKLENDSYACCPVLRLFPDYLEVLENTHVVYTFEDGLFMGKVLKRAKLVTKEEAQKIIDNVQ